MGWFKRMNDWLNLGPSQSIFVECGKGAAPAAPNPPSHRHWRLTGGSSDYYKIEVSSPTTGSQPYVAECNDIIEALGMNFAEGNAFKAVWRKAAARLGNGKPGTTDLYDSEKIVFFGLRLLDMAKSAEQKELP
jgi:hypothetical protein